MNIDSNRYKISTWFHREVSVMLTATEISGRYCCHREVSLVHRLRQKYLVDIAALEKYLLNVEYKEAFRECKLKTMNGP